MLALNKPISTAVHETFSFMMSFPAMSFGDKFHMGRKGGTGRGGCIRRVQISWQSLGSALERPWLALGGPFLPSYAQTGYENSLLGL